MGVLLYVSLILFLAICSTSTSRFLLICCVFVTFLFSSSPIGFGYDWLNYNLVYQEFYFSYDNYRLVYEPLFSLILSFCGYFSLPFQWVIIVSQAVAYFFIYKFVGNFKYSIFAFLCCYSLFGLNLLNEQLRQGVALSIFLFASTKTGRQFFIYTLMAALFHYSAIIGFAYPLLKKAFSSRNALFNLILVVVLSQLALLIFIQLMSTGLAELFLPSFLATKVRQYVLSGMFSETGFSFGVLVNFAIAIFLLLISKSKTDVVNRFGGVFYSIFAIQSRSVFFFYRFSYFFLPFFISAFSNFLEISVRKKFKVNILIIFLIIISLGLKPVFSTLTRQYLLDYKFYWTSNGDFDERERVVCRNLLALDPSLDYCARRY